MESFDIKISGYPAQMEFIQSDAFVTAMIAGVGSGKTHAGALKSLAFCLANPGAWGIVTAPQHRVLEIATIPMYEKIFPEVLIEHKRSRPHAEWRLWNGCRLFFWSTDKPETISGAELAFGHVDEGSLSPYLAYLNIKKRLRQRDKKGEPFPFQMWITTTPRQLNWLYKECMSGAIRVIGATTRDNIYRDAEDYIKNLGLSGKEYEQEIEGKFVSLAGDCLFSSETLDLLLGNCDEPLEVRDTGYTFIWKEKVVGVRYIAGADCSDEGGGGANDLVIADPQTGEVMAEVYANISADKFTQLGYRLLEEYNYPLFAPERNGTVGGIVIEKFQAMGYRNLYKDDKGRPGWYTTSTALPPKVSRFTMLKEFEEACRMRQWLERNSDAVGEMSTFVNENGRYEHRQGCKDDRVMARAICWQMRKQRITPKAQFASFKRTATSYV